MKPEGISNVSARQVTEMNEAGWEQRGTKSRISCLKRVATPQSQQRWPTADSVYSS